MFAAINEALIIAGHKFLYTLLRECGLPLMLATSALHLSGHRRRQIACRPGTSLGVGTGDNHLVPNGGWSICSHLNEVMRP